MTGTCVRARNVGRVYRAPSGPLRVLDEVSLDIEPGSWTVLTGRSGSGKSTLLGLLAGFEPPDEGTIAWGGRPAGAVTAPRWHEVAVVPQALGLLDELPLAEAVGLPLRLLRVPSRQRRQRVDEMLSALGIEHLAARRPEETSLGEQQRAAIARAAVVRPAMLVLDEPTAHLDGHAATLVLALLGRCRQEGTAVVLATHDPGVAAAADRHLHLEAGRLVGGDAAMA